MMKTTRPQALILLGLALLAFSCAGGGGRDVEAAFASISPLEAYGTVKTLALPEYAGRLTGHEGYTAAARWAAQKFWSWGLKAVFPDREDGYLQPYPSPFTVVKRAEMTLFLAQPGARAGREPVTEETKLVAEKDFLPLLFSASGDRTGPLVFAGWGISAPEIGYDDYAGLDVAGKFVLCFRGTPDGDPKYQVHDEHRTRMRTAKDKGALGIIYIYPEVLSNPNGDWIEDFTPAMVSERVADLVFGEVRTTSAELRKSLAETKRPQSFSLGSMVRFDVESEHDPDGVGYNVVGYVEGSDPELRKECVVVGGHFDHTGSHMGLLFPGANDNASGSATVMEIARAFASLAAKPKRSVAFVLFGGEEMGLQGSTYFVENLPSRWSNVDAMFNFDMVGEGDGIGASAGAEPEAFRKAIEEADRRVKTLRRFGVIRGVGVRGSDFAPFFVKGIPTASFASNGPHLAYHQTGDTIYRINPEIMADAARLAFLAAHSWADR
jgi:hypothetical protein